MIYLFGFVTPEHLRFSIQFSSYVHRKTYFQFFRQTFKHTSRDLYFYYSDRSSGGKRWLVDIGSIYRDPAIRNGNLNAGYIWALSTADIPWTGSGWSWNSVYGDDPKVEIFTFGY